MYPLFAICSRKLRLFLQWMINTCWRQGCDVTWNLRLPSCRWVASLRKAISYHYLLLYILADIFVMGTSALIRVDSCHGFPNPRVSHKTLVMFIAVLLSAPFLRNVTRLTRDCCIQLTTYGIVKDTIHSWYFSLYGWLLRFSDRAG